jgi:hypothetical protein
VETASGTSLKFFLKHLSNCLKAVQHPAQLFCLLVVLRLVSHARLPPKFTKRSIFPAFRLL